MRKFFLYFILFLGFVSNPTFATLPTQEELKNQLNEIKQKNPDDPTKKNIIQDLESSIDLLKKIQVQKEEYQNLTTLLSDIDVKIQHSLEEATKQKKQNISHDVNLENEVALEELQQKLDVALNDLKNLQEELKNTTANLVKQNNISTNAQVVLVTNSENSKIITNKLSKEDINNSLKNKFELELELLKLTNEINRTALKNNDKITLYYQTQYDLLQTKENQLQDYINLLQSIISNKRLKESQDKLEQIKNNQLTSEYNGALQDELNINTELSKQILEQTKYANMLSQEKLNLQNILNNLNQDQLALNEQINALEGTLVLSKIIQKQKQNLPLNKKIKDLPDQISELRIKIFDITQKRNDLYAPIKYIDHLAKKNQTSFTDEEIDKLNQILSDRKGLLSDLLSNLNSQLDLSISLNLIQRDISKISKELEEILIQQSFWVKSNKPINVKWIQSLPETSLLQFKSIISKINVSNNNHEYLALVSIIAVALLVLYGFIHLIKPKVQKHLSLLNGQINSLHSDSQWHTPIALFYNMILTLPNVIIFLGITLLIGYFCFTTPLDIWLWGIEMASYLWLFSFILILFNPKNVAVRHFNFSEDNCITFKKAIYRGLLGVLIFVNISIFNNVTEHGISDDVIGQIISILALIFCIFVLAPSFKRAVNIHNKNVSTNKAENIFLTILRVLMQLAPVAMIVLICTGYYYTALKLISLTITSYLIIIVWTLFKYVIYRIVQVSSRRLAYRRLKEERLHKKEEKTVSAADDIAILPNDNETIKIGTLKSQLINIINIILWGLLFVLLYNTWAELILSADYLNNITLWTQNVVTESGTKAQPITLFNLLIALIIAMVTYILVKNIRSILEILIFSRIKFSQGTPYTITTLLTYAIVALGAMGSFGSLGMSWEKLQWLFAALSVGLGFGLQEIFANFISGIIILFERPIRIGDVITVGQFSGTVSRIRIRATTLVDFDGKEVIVPNKNFVTERLTNWALSSATTRVIITVGVAHGSDLELTRKLLLQAAEETDIVLKDPEPLVFFFTFDPHRLIHELRVYVGELADRNTAIDLLNRKIAKLFAENNIVIAFNQLDIAIKDSKTGEDISLPKEIVNG